MTMDRWRRQALLFAGRRARRRPCGARSLALAHAGEGADGS